MNFISNPQIELAFNYVCNTNKNIFLTGKAGTGKTTFLHQIGKDGLKRMVIVAPTGVAAINAGGMTIHSFFQLPFGPQIPGVTDSQNRYSKLRAAKIDLIKSLDLLVIDEISMVRADLLDGIDRVLRTYRDRSKAFGGVQLLMIGDLHQLPPIVKNEEWELLRPHYTTPYFFGSQALQETGLVTIQLKQIFRQSDESFIALLNKVRANEMDDSVLQKLNSRFRANLPGEDEEYITLTAMNAPAHNINIKQLSAIPGKSHFFKAKIDGDFPAHAYPTEEKLELKVGAQVMFVKNDPSFEKLFYNGKIGRIVAIQKEVISVKCKDEEHPISVSALEWTNVKYELNKETKEVSENIVGTFTQHPLKLAWAITIHKSQGLTFERVVIDAANAFAHGQTYVALSRCKSFEGIVLRTKLAFASVKTDAVVQGYTENAEKNAPTEKDLNQAKREYQQSLVIELFDFKRIKRNFQILNRLFLENDLTIAEAALERFLALEDTADAAIISMGKKFLPQLRTYFKEPEMPEENEQLQNRLKKAADYFLDKLNNELLPEIKNLQVISDNDKVKEKALEGLKNLSKEVAIKIACFEICKSKFNTLDYIRAKANAALNFQPSRASRSKKKKEDLGKDTEHPILFARIAEWRDAIADEFELKSYRVLSVKSINDIVKILPTSIGLLRKLKGVGAVKSKQFGKEIVDIVKQYVSEKNIPSDFLPNSGFGQNR